MTEIHTADLCDTHGDAVRVVEPMFARFGGHPACYGRIRTLKLFEDNTKVRALLETPGEGNVLVVDGGGSMRCALVGDQIAQLAVSNGWAGLVVYGCIRDSAAIGEMPLAVFALGTHPRKTVKRNSGEVDVPVTFGGVTFVPGEYLAADADGVIVAAQPLLD